MVDITEIDLHEDADISLAAFNLSELVAMIQSLPDGCRIVFNLFAVEGYNHKEIGEMLGISEGTSKSQYSRAKSLLKVKLNLHNKVYGKYGAAKV
jgi:RNA polymerase sigma-70 factor (ECF subfamily)